MPPRAGGADRIDPAAQRRETDPAADPDTAGGPDPAADPDASPQALRAALQAERAARIEAQRVNGRRDEFMGLVSHELRTPLNAMVGWLHVLESSRQSDAQIAARALAGLNRAVRQQSGLVDTLLETARALRGDLALVREPVDLAAVVAAVMQTRAEAGATLRIETRPSIGPCVVQADARRVGEVLDELLDHAARFADAGPLHIELERDPGGSSGIVSMHFDEPGGAVAWAAFEPPVAQGAGAAPAQRRPGLSIGLVLCERLVELTGGSIAPRRGPPPGLALSWPLA